MTPITDNTLIGIRDGIIKVNPTEGRKMAEELLTLRKLKLVDVVVEPVVKWWACKDGWAKDTVRVETRNNIVFGVTNNQYKAWIGQSWAGEQCEGWETISSEEYLAATQPKPVTNNSGVYKCSVCGVDLPFGDYLIDGAGNSIKRICRKCGEPKPVKPLTLEERVAKLEAILEARAK